MLVGSLAAAPRGAARGQSDRRWLRKRGDAARPGAAVQLALTYLAQQKFPEARAALALAQTCPRSPQEQADYVAAVRQLPQETP